MDKLTVLEKKESNYSLFELKGAFTFDTLDDFRPILYQRVLKTNVVLSLTAVTGIDSDGIGLIFAANTDAEKNHAALYLLDPPDCVLRQLEETGLFDILKQITSIVEIS